MSNDAGDDIEGCLSLIFLVPKYLLQCAFYILALMWIWRHW